MADISLPIRYFSSDTRWDGDQRYPHTTQCYGFEPKSSPPTLYRGQTAVRILTPDRVRIPSDADQRSEVMAIAIPN